MKTTEIFVEQVIIGSLLLLIGALPFADILVSELPKVEPIVPKNYETAAAVAFAAMLVAAAYLVGVVWDRCTDSLLQDLEQHNRLGIAVDKFNKLASAGNHQTDPYPEQQYRMAVLANHDATEYLEYLRTRIRLTRALTVLAPALGLALLLYLLRENRAQDWWWRSQAFVGIAYGLILVTKLGERRIIGYAPPKTDKWEFLERYFARRKKVRWRLFFVATDTAVWLLIGLTAFGIRLAINYGPDLLWVPVAASGLSVLSGWCWWRISATFCKFLRDYWRFGRGPAKNTESV